MEKQDANPIKVSVVVPFEPLRLGLVRTIAEAADMEVIGEADGIAGLVTTAAFRDADVLLVDADAIPRPGAATYNQVNEWLPALKVLFLGTRSDAENLTPDALPTYMRLHTIGFLLKDGPAERLLLSIRLIASGTFVCETELIRHILTRLAQWSSYSADTGNGQALSERETEVLALVARGFANKEIAHELFLSEGTVKAHVSHIMTKLNMDRRTDLVRYALMKGLIPLADELSETAGINGNGYSNGNGSGPHRTVAARG